MVTPGMISTICKEVCKPKTPDRFVREIIGENIQECDDLYALLYIKCVIMADDDLKRLYDRVLYHTRYKKARKGKYKTRKGKEK